MGLAGSSMPWPLARGFLASRIKGSDKMMHVVLCRFTVASAVCVGAACHTRVVKPSENEFAHA